MLLVADDGQVDRCIIKIIDLTPDLHAEKPLIVDTIQDCLMFQLGRKSTQRNSWVLVN